MLAAADIVPNKNKILLKKITSILFLLETSKFSVLLWIVARASQTKLIGLNMCKKQLYLIIRENS